MACNSCVDCRMPASNKTDVCYCTQLASLPLTIQQHYSLLPYWAAHMTGIAQFKCEDNSWCEEWCQVETSQAELRGEERAKCIFGPDEIETDSWNHNKQDSPRHIKQFWFVLLSLLFIDAHNKTGFQFQTPIANSHIRPPFARAPGRYSGRDSMEKVLGWSRDCSWIHQLSSVCILAVHCSNLKMQSSSVSPVASECATR